MISALICMCAPRRVGGTRSLAVTSVDVDFEITVGEGEVGAWGGAMAEKGVIFVSEATLVFHGCSSGTCCAGPRGRQRVDIEWWIDRSSVPS